MYTHYIHTNTHTSLNTEYLKATHYIHMYTLYMYMYTLYMYMYTLYMYMYTHIQTHISVRVNIMYSRNQDKRLSHAHFTSEPHG